MGAVRRQGFGRVCIEGYGSNSLRRKYRVVTVEEPGCRRKYLEADLDVFRPVPGWLAESVGGTLLGGGVTTWGRDSECGGPNVSGSEEDVGCWRGGKRIMVVCTKDGCREKMKERGVTVSEW